MIEQIKFSIMAPVYNVEDYLEDCLKSVLNQTYSNYELILVDDGSTDNCGKICDSYAEKYDNFKVYHKENGGVMSARRFALQYATGDYYIFLDSDDKLKPFALESIAKNLKKHDVDCVVYGFDRVLDGDILYRSRFEDNAPLLIDNKRDLYKKVFFESDYNVLWRKAVRASVFKGWDYSDYFHIDFGEDLLQSLEIYSNCNTVLFVNDDLYSYVVNPESITQKADLKYILEFTVQKRVWDFLKEENVFNNKDFAEFGSLNLTRFISSVVKIGKADITSSEKIQLLKKLNASSYYRNYLLNDKFSAKFPIKRQFVNVLFKLKMYNSLIFILNSSNK